jgi:hypothetical protein
MTTRVEPTSTAVARSRIEESLSKCFGMDSIRQCDACGCIFLITDEGPYVWVDRYAYVDHEGYAHSEECDCHTIRNGQDPEAG